MAKLSPLQHVKKLHGTKEQLLSKVAELLTPNDGESKEDFVKRLKYVANAKLLRLVAVGEKVKELGGRSALITKIADIKQLSKDKDFVAKLGSVPLPRLLDTFLSLSRKAKAAKPTNPAAKAKPADKAKATDKAKPVEKK